MTEREALKLALEALKYPLNQSHEKFNVDMAELLAHRAITAIKEALAQPPQRTWVGLTDEEIALIDWESLVTKKDCVQAIETKIKEKNNG